MRIHYLMHHPDEGLGSIQEWVTQENVTISVTKFYEDFYSLPQLEMFDALIIMGGPQSVYEEEQYPWLKIEKQFIVNCIDAGKKIIGICLGSQFLAELLGGRVYANAQKEIGWFDVTFTDYARDTIFPGLHTTKVFHWHGDTFELPPQAMLLASSEATKNQAFIWKNQCLGLQFHFEVNEKAINGMNCAFDHELVKAQYVQTDVEIKSQIHLVKQNNQQMHDLLSNFLKQ
ncbi:MAG: type 1 glutamine amidotransferase [Cytophagales bacterium]